MFRIAICDDIPEERKKIHFVLKEGLAACGMKAEIIAYKSGAEVLASWKEAEIDLLFLDIYMAEPDGVETARRLREAGCKVIIIFLTTTPDYAIEGYEVEAAGYILKPLEQENLRQLLGRLFQNEKKIMLTLRQGNNVFTLSPSEILYIESNRNKLMIHTVRETIPYYGRMDEVACRLPQKQFLRCHQSFLVNMDRISAAEKDFLMETGEVIPIRVRERKAIREAYYQYIMEKNL